MATKKRVIKKSETVREKALRAQDSQPKRRVIRRTARRVSAPLRILRPLGKPFQARPVRRVGRAVGIVLWPRFFRNAWEELRQVSWPTRKETWRLTLAVFIFAAVFGSIVAATDYGLDKLFRALILK